MDNKSVLILSGGMDSTVLLAQCAEDSSTELYTLSFNYGSKHNARENAAAEAIAAAYGVKNTVIHLPFVEELFRSDLLKSGGDIPEGHYEDASMQRTVVPFRNGIMLSIAAGYAESIGAQRLLYGAHLGDHAIYPDCRAAFVAAMSEAAFYGTYTGLILEAPFVRERLTKRDIALRGKDLGVNFALTYSCYKGGEAHCGVCGTCVERKEALQGFDPTTYLN